MTGVQLVPASPVVSTISGHTLIGVATDLPLFLSVGIVDRSGYTLPLRLAEGADGKCMLPLKTTPPSVRINDPSSSLQSCDDSGALVLMVPVTVNPSGAVMVIREVY